MAKSEKSVHRRIMPLTAWQGRRMDRSPGILMTRHTTDIFAPAIGMRARISLAYMYFETDVSTWGDKG